MTVQVGSGGPIDEMSVGELVVELAEITDAIRRTPTVVERPDGRMSAVNPELGRLARRERQVVAALRRLHTDANP